MQLKIFLWLFSHPNFIKNITFDYKCYVCAPSTLSVSRVSDSTAISGSTIWPSSVVKLILGSVVL